MYPKAVVQTSNRLVRKPMAVDRAKGKLKDKKPKLSPMQSNELRRMYDTDDFSISDLGDIFKVSKPTIYRTLAQQSTGR